MVLKTLRGESPSSGTSQGRMGKLIRVAKAITAAGFVVHRLIRLDMRINRDEILIYCDRYDVAVKGTPDELIESEMLQWFTNNKFLDREHLIKLGKWKSQRALKQYKSEINNDQRVKELTAFSLSSNDEYIRIMCPQLLKGVSWGVASVILHFAYPNDYMILDFRAVWSLEWEQPTLYTFEYWMKYINHIRNLAKENGVTLRQLDKALWQYSKENQK